MLFFCLAVFCEEKVDLFYDDCGALERLPITQVQRDAICERMKFGGGFRSVFDLLELGVFTPEEFARIKPLVTVGKKTEKQTDLERIDSLYFRVGDWFAGEGVSDELVDEWIDALRGRPILAELDFRDFLAMQNVSATDAVALLRHTRDVGPVKNRRQLRSIKGLSNRGYLAVRGFIDYGEMKEIKWGMGGYAQARWGGAISEKEPYSTMRIHMNNGPISGGIALSKESGEVIKYGDWANPFAYPNFKVYSALTRFNVERLKIRHFVIGDYSASFGEGVTFQSGDFFNPRNTGTGFDIRKQGIYPDLSASKTYALRGTGIELKYGPIEPTFFFSIRSKDAVLNIDTTRFDVNIISFKIDPVSGETTIVTDTIVEADTNGFSDLVVGIPNWKDRVKETLIGGDLTFSPLLNLRFGLTGYQAKYNEKWDFKASEIIDSTRLPGGNNNDITELDAELFSATYQQDYRSAIGLNAFWAVGDVSFSAEYAEIVRDSNVILFQRMDGAVDTVRGEKTSPLPIGDDPYGIVAKAQFTSNRLGAIAVFRHYDIAFDNPYNRGFSAYARYKGSVLEDDFRLNDPDLVALAENNPRPMAEEGLYLELYGKPLRVLDGTVEFDAFRRLSDNSDYRRIVLKLYYRPHNNLSLRIWRKWQGRSAENRITPTSFTIDEIRTTASARLSDYSRLGFTVIHSFLKSPPRPRYSYYSDPLDGGAYVGRVVDPSNAIAIDAEINANERLTFFGQAMVYRGWLWNFEDNEFAELESKTDAFRWWLAVRDRLVKNLSLTAKLTVDKPLTATNIDIRNIYGTPEDVLEGGRLIDTRVYWRIQLDYFF